MIFVIHAVKDGQSVQYTYDNINNTVQDDSGKFLNPLLAKKEIVEWYKRTPGNSFDYLPNRNINKIQREVACLDISLGMNCNFNCTYCSQRPFRGKAYSAKPSDVIPFMEMLSRNEITVSEEGKVFLWGGEPLIYYKTLEKLVPLLRERYPVQNFEIITNGSLLTKEKVDFFHKYNVLLSVSDDGLNEFRCEKAVESAKRNDAVFEYAAQTMGDKFFIGIVPSAGNCDVIKQIDTIRERIPSIQRIYTDNVVRCFTIENGDIKKARAMYSLSDDDLIQIHDSRLISLIEGYNLGDKDPKTFRISLAGGVPSQSPAQCGIGSGTVLCLNLRGDIYSCHIFASSGLEMGHLDALDDVVIRFHTSANNRRLCKDCLMYSLCRGDCSRMDDDAHDLSCENRYATLLPNFKKVFNETFGVWVNAIEPQGSMARVMGLLNNRNPTMAEYRKTHRRIPIIQEFNDIHFPPKTPNEKSI